MRLLTRPGRDAKRCGPLQEFGLGYLAGPQSFRAPSRGSRRGPMRGAPPVATGMEGLVTASTLLVWAEPWRQSVMTGRRGCRSQPLHRDTPPEDVHLDVAGLLARGSSPEVPPSRDKVPVTRFGLRLAAYSCGGGLRHHTGFPLSSRAERPKNHDAIRLGAGRTRCQAGHKDIYIWT